ncbi:MAG: primosomal protein N' [Oceanobacter sp.]
MPFFVVQVAVPVPLRRSFDYLPVPGSVESDYQAGQRVRLNFANQLLTGIVLATKTDSDVAENKLKPLLEKIDNDPLLDEEALKLGQWLSRYYHQSLGEALDLMLPAMLRRGSQLSEVDERHWVRLADTNTEVALRGKQQQALWRVFGQQSDWQHSQLTQQGFSLAQLRKLAEQGLIEEQDRLVTPGTSTQDKNETSEARALNSEQQKSLDELLPMLGKFGVALLEGVTGSGKTEVYLQLIQSVLDNGQQALVLVPEIGLTPQTVRRFSTRFNVPVSLMHSGLNDRERLQAWRQCREGMARILIGTRSAVFTPMSELGLIIIDEEHDASFKQQDGLRYSARDFALMRAKQMQIPVLLGSATPSLESLHNALTQRYKHLKLTRRAGNAKPPGLMLHSTLHKPLTAGLSQAVLARIQKHVEQGQQVLMFINRRGYAPLFACQTCGWVAECRRCDARMTLHQSPLRLHCHHCDAQEAVPDVCSNCHSESVGALGMGTERLEQALRTIFPYTEITRVDRDSARSKQAFDQLLDEVHQPGSRILIGTQMLAKGHHFPSVTLVVVLDADSGLFSADFRGMEHTAQLITQVAGRAGRAELPGEVWVQTLYADHPLLNLLIDDGYHALALSMLEQRLEHQLPPYTHLAILRAESEDKSLATTLLQEARSQIHHLSTQGLKLGKPPVSTLGPYPAVMERKAGRYRHLLQIISADRSTLHSVLDPLVDYLQQRKGQHKLRWHLDVDPIDSL